MMVLLFLQAVAVNRAQQAKGSTHA
jgi:hypothetical protein